MSNPAVRLGLESWVGFGERERKGEKRRWHNSATMLGKGRRRQYTWPRAVSVSRELQGEGGRSPLSVESLLPERPFSVWFDSMGNNAWAHSLGLLLGFLLLAQAMGAGV